MLERAELTLILCCLKGRKLLQLSLPCCSVVACKLFYSITERVEILSLIFVPPAEGGGMEISMKHMKFIKTAGIIVLIFVVIVILLSIVILALTHN